MVSENAEFHADFESVGKVLKKCTILQLFQRIRYQREILRFLVPFLI
jgi:hypothetical protein